MKFHRFLLPYLIVLLMAGASFADESKEEEKMEDDTYESGFALIPWSAFIGGGDAFIAGVDWVFGKVRKNLYEYYNQYPFGVQNLDMMEVL